MLTKSGRAELYIDEYTGAFSLRDASANWSISGGATGGFEMNVPLPGRGLNTARFEDQKLASFRVMDGGVELRWEKVVTPFGGALDISFIARIAPVDGGFAFTGRVENRSPYPVEHVAFPRLGELRRPEGSPRFVRRAVGYTFLSETEMYPRFATEVGYWSCERPFQHADAIDSPFVLMEGGGRGLYAGVHEKAARYQAQFFYDVSPAVADSMEQRVDTPMDDGLFRPALSFSVTHIPFLAPGASVELSPVFLATYEGGWENGATYYRDWRKTWKPEPNLPAWMREPHAWYQVQLNSYGGSLRYRYTDVVELGRRCAENGISAMQLTGWTLEGQDGHTPSCDTDPRLGTREELREAIARVEAMGVHVILYVKWIFADTRTREFRDTLKDCASRDMYGDIQSFQGYPYDRPALWAGSNRHRLALMCMESDRWRAHCREELKKCLYLGASGILADESQHHGGYAYCFSADHGHETPAYLYAGDAILAREMGEDAGSDYLICGEGLYDLETPEYQVSYIRAAKGAENAFRFFAPRFPMVCGFWGYNDRMAVNGCLLHGFIMEYESRHFRGYADEFPQTLAYGHQVDALRARYRAYLWDGEYMGRIGACVETEGGVAYSVFRVESGKKAVVIANNGDATAHVRVYGLEGTLALVTPERPDPAPCTGEADVAGLCAAVFLEI